MAIQINSAKRDPEDQKRLWDESVAAGRPGRGPKGLPIAKPGSSLHEKGEAVDIQNYLDPQVIAAFNKQGLSQKVPGDPVHFQARYGGIADGPLSGYPATLHGNEAILPLDPESILTKLLKTKEADLSMSKTASANAVDANGIIAALMAMMEEKFDDMIDVLQEGNDTSEELLKVARV